MMTGNINALGAPPSGDDLIYDRSTYSENLELVIHYARYVYSGYYVHGVWERVNDPSRE